MHPQVSHAYTRRWWGGIWICPQLDGTLFQYTALIPVTWSTRVDGNLQFLWSCTSPTPISHKHNTKEAKFVIIWKWIQFIFISTCNTWFLTVFELCQFKCTNITFSGFPTMPSGLLGFHKWKFFKADRVNLE